MISCMKIQRDTAIPTPINHVQSNNKFPLKYVKLISSNYLLRLYERLLHFHAVQKED